MKTKKSGFTLVELLVVMSVIAVLMGILLPALGAARRSAYKTGCKQNLHGCAIAFKMYTDENRNVMPTIINMPVSTQADANYSLYSTLKKYISGPEALKCPADRYEGKNTSYFHEEGSSYEYNENLYEKRIEDDWFAKRFGTSEVWILHDYDGFHGKKLASDSDGERNMGDTASYSVGAFMYLYADTLVGDRKRSK